MDQLAQVLVFGSDDEFINLLDQGAYGLRPTRRFASYGLRPTRRFASYNMNLRNAYTQGLLPFVRRFASSRSETVRRFASSRSETVGAILFQTDVGNMEFMISLSNLRFAQINLSEA